MNSQLKIFLNIAAACNNEYYKDLGDTELLMNDDTTLDHFKIKVKPHEGLHKDIEYIITIQFQEPDTWPYVYIDSEIYDKIKTSQYLKSKGTNGKHKGICIKHLGYAYGFNKYFKELCANKWENYVYYLITVFNNLQDFEKGNGLKSNYKNILGI
jgi:hypothetical protein